MTDFPRSVALWAGTTDDARLDNDETKIADYWDSIRRAIRRAETYQAEQQQGRYGAEGGATGAEVEVDPETSGSASLGRTGGEGVAARPHSECRSQARYGSGPDTVRMGKEYTAAELRRVVPEVFGADPAARSEL